MPGGFTIRPFRSGDEFAICELHAATIRSVSETLYSRDQIESWAGGKTPDGYVRMQTEMGEIYRVAADETDTPVGFCSFRDDEIFGIYVSPSWQGKGVGQALMQVAETELTAGGARDLKVHAAKSAWSFYEHCGYTQVRRDVFETRGGLSLETARYQKRVGG